MSELSIAISVVGILCSISSIALAYLAFKRNLKSDDKSEGKYEGQLLTDISYIAKTLQKLNEDVTKLDERNRTMVERLAKVEQAIQIFTKT
ncbi:MAG: hypothetical protein NC310_02975 [Roseburia sp.]|nr:hypothetical protein [Anaeroplasma bactoclasticum]MCM1196021.1 hypothetical protein [Roseburia sp.]MCM1557085.1 hypothetical protein [Anaeroplasma bactoclasticum]